MDITPPRTISPVAAKTDASPKSVTWNWADGAAADPKSIRERAVDAADSKAVSPVQRNLQSSSTMVEDSFQPQFESLKLSFTMGDKPSSQGHDHDNEFPLRESAKNHEQEWKDEGEIHEVELKDFAKTFRDNNTVEEETEEVHETSRGVKYLISRVPLNPKLKSFVSSRFMDKDDKVTDVSVCGDETVEISLPRELDRSNGSLASNDSNPAIAKGGGIGADTCFDETAFDEAVFREWVDDTFSIQTKLLKLDVCTSVKTEEEPNEDTPHNTKSASSVSILAEFESGEKEVFETDFLAQNNKGERMKKLLSQVKLNPSNLPQVKFNPSNLPQVKFNRSLSQVKLNSKFRSFRRGNSSFPFAGELKTPKSDVDQSKHLITSDEYEVDTDPITRAIYEGIMAKGSETTASIADKTQETAISNTDKTEADGANDDDLCADEKLEFDSRENGGDKGMKRFMSRVKLNSKLRSFKLSKSPELDLKETLLGPPCVTSDEPNEYELDVAKEDVPVDTRMKGFDNMHAFETKVGNVKMVQPDSKKVISQQSNKCVNDRQNDVTVDDDVDEDDELKVSVRVKEDASRCFRSSKARSSNLPVFASSRDRISSAMGEEMGTAGATEMKTIEEEEASAEEQRDQPPEFRQMEVTLRFKALAGISQITSRKSSSDQDGFDDTLKAVVTYRRNTIASDRFVSTHVPSRPVFLEQLPDPAHAQVYAQWPGGPRDDDSNSTTLLMSSVSLTRTVRRVRNFDNWSNGTTVGGSQVKEPDEKESKQFLASLSKAFAPELLDLQVGLMKGSNEIIPLGIATVVIPGEYKRMQLDIPVVRNYYSGENAPSKNRSFSQICGMTKSPKDHVFFSAAKDTKYKITEGAFLRLELNIAPAATAPSTPIPRTIPPHHLNANSRKVDFRYGPINEALRRRRKIDQLLGSKKKLPLHQRVQLYLELRSRKGSNVNNKASLSSKEVCIARQTEVSEVSCELLSRTSIRETSEVDDMSTSLAMDQYDDSSSWASSAPSTKCSNSYILPRSIMIDDDKQDGRLSPDSQHSTILSFQPKASALPASVASAGSNRQDEIMTASSEHSGASAIISGQPKEGSGPSVSSLLVNKQDGRQTPSSQISGRGENQSHYSSSLCSVFTTNHPQKQTIAQNIIDLLLCDHNNIDLCVKETNALKYYAQEQEEKIAQLWAPFLPDEFSIEETFADEDTFASLESLSVSGNLKRQR